jgi:hypothetical protein
MINVSWDPDALEMRLTGIRDALGDLRPVWPQVHEIFIAFIKEIFKSEGSYAGQGQWVPLNPTYARRKQRMWGMKPILQASGAFKTAFIVPSDRDHVYKTGPDFMEAGVRTRYGKAHQFGYPPNNLPARPILQRFTKAEGADVVDAILAHVLKVAARKKPGQR